MEKELVKSILIDAARSNKGLLYKEILQKMNLKNTNKNRTSLFVAISQIGDDCFDAGLPLLNGLVINESGLPGDGFFVWYGQRKDMWVSIYDRYLCKSIAKNITYECFQYYSQGQS